MSDKSLKLNLHFYFYPALKMQRNIDVARLRYELKIFIFLDFVVYYQIYPTKKRIALLSYNRYCSALYTSDDDGIAWGCWSACWWHEDACPRRSSWTLPGRPS